MILKRIHSQTYYWKGDYTGLFPSKSVGAVYNAGSRRSLSRAHYTYHQKRLPATDILICYLIIISSQLPFINTSLIKQTKNMIICYQNNIENKVGHNSGHATIAAPIGCSCSVVVDDGQLYGCITYTYPACMTN